MEASEEEDCINIYSKENSMKIWFAIALHLLLIDGKQLNQYGAVHLNHNRCLSENEDKHKSDAFCFVQYSDLLATDDLALNK